jgi:hypothetical protein
MIHASEESRQSVSIDQLPINPRSITGASSCPSWTRIPRTRCWVCIHESLEFSRIRTIRFINLQTSSPAFIRANSCHSWT